LAFKVPTMYRLDRMPGDADVRLDKGPALAVLLIALLLSSPAAYAQSVSEGLSVTVVPQQQSIVGITLIPNPGWTVESVQMPTQAIMIPSQSSVDVKNDKGGTLLRPSQCDAIGPARQPGEGRAAPPHGPVATRQLCAPAALLSEPGGDEGDAEPDR